MTSLSMELKQVLIRRIENADSHEILEIASDLCEREAPVEVVFRDIRQVPRFRKIGTGGDAIFTGTEDWVAVEDTSTGLIWSRDDIGERHTWADAQKVAADVKLCGLTGWRLPTITELLSLVDYNQHAPAIDKTFFPNCKSDWYWTSTSYAASPGDYAWSVDFGSGDSDWYGQSSRGLVRAVRPRQ